MKKRAGKSIIQTSAGIILLAVLLPLLACLQYIWIGQLGDRELEHIRSTVTAGANQLCRDFDLEIGNMYSFFNLKADSQESALKQLKSRYIGWINSSRNPELLREIVLVTALANGKYDFEKYDCSNDVLEKVDFHLGGADPELLFPRLDDDERLILGAEFPIISVIPALIVANFPKIYEDISVNAPDYILLVLDDVFLRDTYFPKLITNYLPAGGIDDFNVLITRNSPRREVAFTFGRTSSTDIDGAPDVSRDFFNLPGRDFAYIFEQESRPEEFGRNIQTRLEQARISDTPSDAEALTMIVEKKPTHERIEERWRLTVRHRSGSLAAAVGEIRLGNMLISGAVLLLLALSAVLVIRSAGRSRKLAQKQMNFVANVTHELMTPLAIMTGAGENLADSVVSDTEKTREYGRVIHGEGKRLKGMLEQVLLLSRIKAGPRSRAYTKVNPGELISYALEGCSGQLSGKMMGPELDIEKELPIILADRQAILSVFKNIISNAVKFSPPESRFQIRICCMEVKERRSLVFEFQDHGQGIREEELGEIFEPFFRGEEAIREQVEGSGLGLSIAKGVIGEMGGRIEVSSEIGLGSRFKVIIPVNEDV